MNAHNAFPGPGFPSRCASIRAIPRTPAFRCEFPDSVSGAAPASGKHAVGICMLAQARGQENSG